MTVLPNKESTQTKSEQVAEMFNAISHRYDFLNHFLSLGIDKSWRKKAILYLKPFHPKILLDIATGTGDFAIQALQLNPDKIVGVDISEGMLAMGRKKIQTLGVSKKIEMILASSENLPFETGTFDAVTVAFGVRNFENLERGIKEIFRVLKPEGRVVILEFAKPESFPFKQVYGFYFKIILPKIGAWFSKNPRAYTYLPESVDAFPYGIRFMNVLSSSGFSEVKSQSLTFGISAIYTAVKK